MVSEKQLPTNQENGRLGGGKTEADRAAWRLNTVSHGFTSRAILLRDEDGRALDVLREGLMEALAPLGEMEILMADLIVADAWRLRRSIKVENDLLQGSLDFYAGRIAKAPAEIIAQAKIESIAMVPWHLLITHGMEKEGALAKLETYRTAIEKHMYKSIHELRLMQAARQGKKAILPLPFAFDSPG